MFKWYYYHFLISLLDSDLPKISVSVPSISWAVLALLMLHSFFARRRQSNLVWLRKSASFWYIYGFLNLHHFLPRWAICSDGKLSGFSNYPDPGSDPDPNLNYPDPIRIQKYCFKSPFFGHFWNHKSGNTGSTDMFYTSFYSLKCVE